LDIAVIAVSILVSAAGLALAYSFRPRVSDQLLVAGIFGGCSYTLAGMLVGFPRVSLAYACAVFTLLCVGATWLNLSGKYKQRDEAVPSIDAN